MLYTTLDLAKELAAQLGHTDLGVTSARSHNAGDAVTGRITSGVIFRLDNGQEFYAEITRWGGPRL